MLVMAKENAAMYGVEEMEEAEVKEDRVVLEHESSSQTRIEKPVDILCQ